jgi:flavin-binding protein dodecin
MTSIGPKIYWIEAVSIAIIYRCCRFGVARRTDSVAELPSQARCNGAVEWRQSPRNPIQKRKEDKMADSVYKFIDLVGSSTTSWEDAAKNAVETASKSLRDLRVAEILKLDMKVENGKVTAYRARVKLSFKYASD